MKHLKMFEVKCYYIPKGPPLTSQSFYLLRYLICISAIVLEWHPLIICHKDDVEGRNNFLKGTLTFQKEIWYSNSSLKCK